MANDTAAGETPARAATSSIVGRRRVSFRAYVGYRSHRGLKRFSLREGINLRLIRAVAAGLVLAAIIGPAAAQAAAPELSITDRLQDRRYAAAGERARIIGFQDGRFYANGWHIAGEMGGIWSEPIKLVDGVWFGIDDQWVGRATEFTSGWGYVKFDLPDHRRPAARAHRLRARRPPRRADRPEADQPGRLGPHRHGQGRRPLRAAGRVPVELRQHAARARPAARHGDRRGRRAALPRAGHPAAPERDAARLRRLRGVRPPAVRRRGQHGRQRTPRPAGQQRLHRPGDAERTATTARSARAPAGSCATA